MNIKKQKPQRIEKLSDLIKIKEGDVVEFQQLSMLPLQRGYVESISKPEEIPSVTIIMRNLGDDIVRQTLSLGDCCIIQSKLKDRYSQSFTEPYESLDRKLRERDL